MTHTEVLIMLAELLGGLAFFLYGMSAMSGGLEKMAGGRLERTLKKVGRNDLMGFTLGAGITIAIQSSSAMTVMLVGLVNSGILSFADTFGMIMGSHVGTTLTAWILTLSGISGDNFFLTLLQPTTFAPILAFIGVVMRMISKKERTRNLGVILLGFAVLMAGMSMMSASMDTFRNDSAFQSLLGVFTNGYYGPVVAFLVATVFTGIIQSSAATVAIVEAMALAMFNSGDPLTYQVAIPLVLGANVGTCMTALISSIGTSKDAKRVVAMHIYTNAIGGLVGVIGVYVVGMVSPDLLALPVGMIGVALIHSLFNIINTIVFIPFKRPMLRLCEKTVRSSNAETHTVFLDERLFNNPPLALSECRRLCVEMADYARTALRSGLELVQVYDDKKAEQVRELETLTDKYEDKLGTYLVRLSGSQLGGDDSHAVGRMLHSIGDFERIGDHALNLVDVAQEMKDKKIAFSGPAKAEMAVMSKAVAEILDLAVDSFIRDDVADAARVEPLEQVIDKLNDEMKARHVERLQRGECTIELGFVFNDYLTNCERVADHCSNVAVYTLQRHSAKVDPHKFLRMVKTEHTGHYEEDFTAFEEKYSLDSVGE